MKKIIKIIFSVIGVALICLMILGQVIKTTVNPMMDSNTASGEFARMIQRVNNDCPIPAAMGKGTITAVKLEDGYVTYYISYSPEFMNVLSKFHNDEIVKEGMLMCILCLNGQGNKNGDIVTDALIRFGYGLRVVIEQSANGKFEFKVAADEIENLRKKFQLNPHEALYNLLSLCIDAERINLPQDMGDGILMTDLTLNDDNIICAFQFDETTYPFEVIETNKEQMKENLIHESLSQPESHSLFYMCKVSHTGLIYRYVGKQSHREIDIEIPSDEIRLLVDTPADLNIQ